MADVLLSSCLKERRQVLLNRLTCRLSRISFVTKALCQYLSFVAANLICSLYELIPRLRRLVANRTKAFSLYISNSVLTPSHFQLRVSCVRSHFILHSRREPGASLRKLALRICSYVILHVTTNSNEKKQQQPECIFPRSRWRLDK